SPSNQMADISSEPGGCHEVCSRVEFFMPQEVGVGTILIKEWPLMTQFFGVESEFCSGNWSLVNALDGFALDRTIHAAGWNFFFMAAELRVVFLGALGAKQIRNALKRILGKV